jgi:vacuolar-type H+-ATPase subunit F/Vma7
MHPLLTSLFLQHVTNPPDSQKNFLVVDNKTETSAIEAAFESFTTERKDIGIILINQHVRITIMRHLGREQREMEY